MKKSEWRKTPYAGTQAENTEKNLARLFEKYGISDYAYSRGQINGRPAYQVQFVMEEKRYRIRLEALACKDASDLELVSQIQRVIYYRLKSMLEEANVFSTPEEIMFAYLELPEGITLFEAAKDKLDQLSAGSVVGFLTDGV